MECRFDFFAQVSPALPGAISVIDRVAASKPLVIVFGAVAEVLSLVLTVAIPVGVVAFMVIKPVAGLGVNVAKGVLAK